MAAVNPYLIPNPYLQQTFQQRGPVAGPEVNLRGDSANGYTGSTTPQSVGNALSQPRQASTSTGVGSRSGQNPFADMLGHSMTLKPQIQPQIQPPPIDINRKTKIQPPRPGNAPSPQLTLMGGGDGPQGRVIVEGPDALRRGDGSGGIGQPVGGGVGTGGTGTVARPGVVAPPSSVYDPTKPIDPASNRPPDYDAFEQWQQTSGRNSGAAGMDNYQFYDWLKNKGYGDLDTSDPENAAAWYSTQGPEFAAVNSFDVQTYRAQNGGNPAVDFATWYRAGGRGQAPVAATPQNPQTPATPIDIGNGLQLDPIRGGYFTIGADGSKQWFKSGPNGTWVPWNREQELATGQTGVSSNWMPTPTPTPTNAGTNGQTASNTPPPSTTPPPTDGTGATTVGNGSGNGNGNSTSTLSQTSTPGQATLRDGNEVLRNVVSTVSQMYGPQFEQDRNDLQRRLLHVGSATGAVNSGGFVPSVGRELGNLAAKQSAQLGEEISDQFTSAQQLATTQYIAELDAGIRNLQIRTNADLERAAQELQKYGIDKNDLLQRYQSELSLKGVQYSADRGVDAAALHAAAAQAGASASASAAKYDADVRRELGILGYDVAREDNIMRYQLGIASLGPDWAKFILGSDPSSLFPGGNAGSVIFT